MIDVSVNDCWLQAYRANVYSQTGEDGVIAKVLEMLPASDGWCVEFGAWDGASLSNTRNLIESHGYSAVLIEGDKRRFDQLAERYRQQDHVIPVNCFVGFEKVDGLDSILEKTPIPQDFDFLSIDIDGNDYHTWAAVSRYSPKIVCIEFNPTIPPHIAFVQPANPRLSQGSSLLALTNLAKEKGYELVAALPFNAVFVKSEYFPLFNISNNAPDHLWPHREKITYMYSGYDGTIFLEGARRLPWHKLDLRARSFQRLPKILRLYPGQYTLWHKALFGCYILLTDPRRFLQEIWKRASGQESTFE